MMEFRCGQAASPSRSGLAPDPHDAFYLEEVNDSNDSRWNSRKISIPAIRKTKRALDWRQRGKVGHFWLPAENPCRQHSESAQQIPFMWLMRSELARAVCDSIVCAGAKRCHPRCSYPAATNAHRPPDRRRAHGEPPVRPLGLDRWANRKSSTSQRLTIRTFGS